jgi:hypothetical protein
MNDTLKKWLLYFGGLLLVWMTDTLILPRFDLSAAPVLLPLCVVAAAVLEGAFTGAQFGMAAGLVWGLLYAGASPFRIPLLTVAGMVCGAVTQYALRRSLSGCLLCAAGTMGVLSLLNILRGIITGLAEPGALVLTALMESAVSLVCAPFVYGVFYWIYRKTGGKPV